MLVGLGIGVLIYNYTGKEDYDKKIATGAQLELGWPCLSIFIFGYCTVWLNIFPLYYKEQMMPAGGNIRANQFLYRQATDNDGAQSAVVLYAEGKIGSYNRGNRSIGHFLESVLPILVTLPVGYLIYPVATAIILIIYSLARVSHQIGYATVGFGAHQPGFILDRLTTFIMMGLVVMSGVMMLMHDGGDMAEEMAETVAAATGDRL